MKLPNKVTPYLESTLAKIPIILGFLKDKDFTALSLFEKVKTKMNIEEFIDVLDCLFALKEITLKGEILHYVKRNIL